MFLCLQLFHGLMFSLFVMYLKKLRASDWLKTSTFSWNTSANYKYRARFQNFVCLDFLRFCVILCITAKYTCPTGSAILSIKEGVRKKKRMCTFEKKEKNKLKFNDCHDNFFFKTFLTILRKVIFSSIDDKCTKSTSVNCKEVIVCKFKCMF